jgi:hypothetical protein
MAAASFAAPGEDREIRRVAPATELVGDATLDTLFVAARAVADAVLYEGYVLYPYRRSATKNQGPRWQFGVLSPRAATGGGPADDTMVAGSVESWFSQTQCLVEGADGGNVAVRLRFLQVQRKTVEQLADDGSFHAVSQLDVDGQLHVSFDEALPHERDVSFPVADLLTGTRTREFAAPGQLSIEPITDRSGWPVGRVVRARRPICARVSLQIADAGTPFPLRRLTVLTENTVDGVPAGTPRDEVLAHSLVATHCFISVSTGRFVSLLDPPEWAASAAAQCANVHTFPVLAGDREERDLVLSSPIILYDHPQVAPESPGDLFDATEIDEILSLRTLTLSDAEKREARATDPLAADVINRVDAMPPELLAKLHGAVRSLRRLPDTARVVGGEVAVGGAVRIRPRRRGSDAHDMFLAGRTARVRRVLTDVDGSLHVAVSIDDDPAAELHGWYGRFHYFAPDELELVDAAATERAP